MNTQLHIRNMVCNRCIKVVRDELTNLGLHIEDIRLGEVFLTESGEEIDYEVVKKTLEANGFELLDDRKSLLIERVKNAVVEVVHQKETIDMHINWSHYIQEKVGVDYQYLSSLFSSTEGITIEKYIILQRIERVKEWLVYDEYNTSEIAYKLGYSSVQHLSTQFKKVTGMTPSEFKKLHVRDRKPLDEVGGADWSKPS